MIGVDFKVLAESTRLYARAIEDALKDAPSVLESVACSKCGGVRMAKYHPGKSSYGVRIPSHMTMRCETCGYSSLATALDERSEQTQT